MLLLLMLDQIMLPGKPLPARCGPTLEEWLVGFMLISHMFLKISGGLLADELTTAITATENAICKFAGRPCRCMMGTKLLTATESVRYIMEAR